MKIVIVGAGFTGVQLAKLLINEKKQVVLIDNDEETIRHASNSLDCSLVCADGNNLETLENAGIKNADALVCVTSSDEVNMITCSLVDSVYPNVLKIARVRNYAYYVNSANAEKKHQNEFSENHRPLYGIDFMIHPDVEAADAIYQTVQNGAVGSILTFDESDLQIVRITVEKNCDFDGVLLKDIKTKTQIPFLIAYIEKNGETSLPSGETKIEQNDVLGILALKNDLTKISLLFGNKINEMKKIALVGAGRIGSIVSTKLLENHKQNIGFNLFSSFNKFKNLTSKKNFDLVIIDSNENLAKNASEKFPNARVLNADATDENFLREEGITNFDLVICTTHNHEMNMILAAYLESLGVKQTISLVTSSAFSEIATKLGIDVPIPLRDTVVDSIMSHLRGKTVKGIHTITNSQLQIIECEIPQNSKIAGKYLKEIPNKKSFLVLMTKPNGMNDYQIANGNTIINNGDHIVLITSLENPSGLFE